MRPSCADGVLEDACSELTPAGRVAATMVLAPVTAEGRYALYSRAEVKAIIRRAQEEVATEGER